jgi:hypothetical protein
VSSAVIRDPNRGAAHVQDIRRDDLVTESVKYPGGVGMKTDDTLAPVMRRSHPTATRRKMYTSGVFLRIYALNKPELWLLKTRE